MKYTYKKRHFK